MCWFAWFNFNDEKLLKKIWKRLKDRNKDWEKFHYSDNVSFYHASLRLTDKDKNTEQPFIYNNLLIWFVWEIYNKEYLLNLIWLKDKNKFTELEVIWLLFSKFGSKFIDYLNWEFAIFIFDKKTEKYFLFRDRYWVHSVYYKILNDKIFFSSEIKSLIFDKNDIKINKNALIEYMTFNFSISPNTIIDWINILKPWYYLEYSNNSYKINKYSKYIYQEKKISFIDTLEKAVIRRIPKNIDKIFVPISWWADSNLVLFFLSKYFKWEIITYTFFNKNNLEDVNTAKCNVKKYGFKHLLINIDEFNNFDYENNIIYHEWLVKLFNIWKILRNKYPEYKDVNIEFTWDWREELLLVNNHYNYKEMVLKYKYFNTNKMINKYNITQEFLNLNMFDFNLQLIEKLTLNNLIERRLPFTDYELLRYKNYKNYKKEAREFLEAKGISIVEWTYGHNNGINFKYLSINDLKKYLKYFILQLQKNI